MGLFNRLWDCWVMMMRTKPQYISVLGRKRSSIHSPQKGISGDEKNCTTRLKSCVCIIVMCCSVSYGIVLLLLQDASSLTAANLVIPLIVAGIASVSGGVCLSEYISSRTQEVPSIYSCCYQYSSEVLAFFIGWSWLFSQVAMVAAICKISSMLVNQWTGNVLHNYLDQWFYSYADAIPSMAFVLGFTLFVMTGLNDSIIWYACSIPLVFVLIVSSFILTRALNKEPQLHEGTWFEVQSISQVIKASSLCMLFFSGPQSILRISQKQVKAQTAAVLGYLNAICFFLILILVLGTLQSDSLFNLKTTPADTASVMLAKHIIFLICLCIMGIETFYPMHFVIEDMSSDGLLFRSFSKKSRPFCVPVASATVQVISVIVVGLLVTLLSLEELLHLSVIFPVMVNSIAPFLVLLQRYRDNTSWQYEPMFHTTAKSIRDKSKTKNEESQYTNGMGFDHTDSFEMSTTCIQEDSSEDSSDTDIDSMVQQYKDQARIANMATLEEHDASDKVPEPTPSSSFRAKLDIVFLVLLSLGSSLALNFANMDDKFYLVIVALVCLLASTCMQGFLLCLPQNRTSKSVCCGTTPRLPWTPGLSSLLNTCLYTNCVLLNWRIYLGWFISGVLIYFAYGIRSSTAANSFYNLQPAHVALCPIPSYGNKCVAQVVPSQRKKSKHKKNVKRKPLMA